MAPERGDTDFESRLKIVEIDGAVKNMAADISDIKACIKELTMNLSSYSNLHTMITNMQDTANQTVKRADERWNELIRVREGQICANEARHAATEAICDTHAKTLASYDGSLRATRWIVLVLIGVLSAVGVKNYMADDVGSAAMKTNATHIRKIENELLAHNPAFKPADP